MKKENMEKRIKSINKKIEKIEGDRLKLRRNKEYNQRELRNFAKNKDFKRYEKVFTKQNFYLTQLEQLDDTINGYKEEVKELNEKIDALIYEEKTKEYYNNLKAFDNTMIEKLKRAIISANQLHSLKGFDPNVGIEIYTYYTRESNRFKREDIEIYSDLIRSIKDNFIVLTDYLTRTLKMPAVAREGFRLGRFSTMKNLIVRRISTVISDVENRNEKTTEEKVRGLFKK